MFSFIVSTCIQNNTHSKQLNRCIESIRKYHNNLIILINDSEQQYDNDIYELIDKYGNINIVHSIVKGSADQQCFKLILECNKLTDRYIIIQDSMILNSQLDNVEQINNVCFLWHFTNHIVDWDRINEPLTQYNVKHNIITHSDLIKHHLLRHYYENNSFLTYALDCLENKNKWSGCFGNCCIITKSFLMKMNKEVKFVDLFVNNTSNRERRMNESIFSIICHFCLPDVSFTNSYDGLYYDGYTVNIHSGQPSGFDNLEWCCVNKRISKISFNR